MSAAAAFPDALVIDADLAELARIVVTAFTFQALPAIADLAGFAVAVCEAGLARLDARIVHAPHIVQARRQRVLIAIAIVGATPITALADPKGTADGPGLAVG